MAATLAKRPMLVQDGKRLVPSDRQFHVTLVAQYIRDHGGRTRWISIAELARTFFQRDSKSNRVRMRQRMHYVWNEALNHMGLLLVYESQRDGLHLCLHACKIYDPRSTEEQQHLQARLARMVKNRQLKAAQLQTALALAEQQDTVRAKPPTEAASALPLG